MALPVHLALATKLLLVVHMRATYPNEIGLLKPIHADPETGYRFYTMDQLPHLHRILAFKELGLGLAQIVQILDEGISPEALQGMLRLRQAQLQQHLQAGQEQLVRIEARLRSLEQGSCLPVYEVVLKAVKSIIRSCFILGVRTSIPHVRWRLSHLLTGETPLL
jgi:DNA-binding transcriptional MerR regulator